MSAAVPPPAAPTPVARVRRGAARRDELFDALVALVLADGFTGTTLDDLAAGLRCSKRTLYGLADSKEQLVRAVVVRFFRDATVRVEAAVATRTDPVERLSTYLRAVAAELAPASATFFEDVASFAPAAEIYERNTRAAARRIREIIAEGVASGAFRDVHVGFAAEVIAGAMEAIQRRRIATTTGLADAEAYEQLAGLLVGGLRV